MTASSKCACSITLLAGGFATETATETILYATDGRKTATLDSEARPIGGGTEVLIGIPQEKVDAGPSRYRVRTLDGRVLWEGKSTNGPPRACGDWLLAPDGVISIYDGVRVVSPGDGSGLYACLGAGRDWIAMPDRVIVTNGRSWQPTSGTLDLVDGRLVNTVADTSAGAKAVVVYSPTEPAAAAVPELVTAPDFMVTLHFTSLTTIGGAGATEIARVSYDPTTRRWLVGADSIIQAGRSTVRSPARETFAVSDRGDVTATLPTDTRAVSPCGPYSIGLDDDVARVVVRREDGGVVHIGSQPDPGHVVAAGYRCVGYSDDHLALAPPNGQGIILLPLHAQARALSLPKATGFTSGRPFAVTPRTPTITVYPVVRQ